MKITYCKACGKPVVWITTTQGKSMPCDAAMIKFKPGGKDRAVTPEGKVVSCTIIREPTTGNSSDTDIGYTTHWSTCPQAYKFKKGK